MSEKVIEVKTERCSMCDFSVKMIDKNIDKDFCILFKKFREDNDCFLMGNDIRVTSLIEEPKEQLSFL